MTGNPFTIIFGIEPSAPIKRIKEAGKRFCFLTFQII